MANATQRDNGGIAVSLILAVAGVFGFYEGTKLSTFAGIFPQTFSAILVISSLAYAVIALMRGGVCKAKGMIDFPVRGFLVPVVLALWAIFMEYGGFLACGFAGYFCLAMLANQSGRLTLRYALIHAVISFIVVGAFYILFKVFLGVPLPVGSLDLPGRFAMIFKAFSF